MIVPLVVVAFLVFSRTAALLATMPLASGLGVPVWARLAVAVPLTAVLLPTAGAYDGDYTLSALVAALLREVVMGSAMGFVVQAVFQVLSSAFEAIGSQAGLAVAAYFDPLLKMQSSVLASLATWLATGAFLGADMHLACIRAVSLSFERAPPGAPVLGADGFTNLVAFSEACLRSGVELAGPLTIFTFIVHLGQSLLARMAPNIQLFWAIGPVLSIGLGLLVLAASLPAILNGWFSMLPQALDVMNALPAGR
jgi:flagellar biosynthetic protein FliR